MAPTLVGTTQGKYEVLELLGKGGMGEVCHARHTILERDVAIKVLSSALGDDEEMVQRFQQEARAVNKIAHESIVEITDFDTLSDGRSFYVMELLKGKSLSAHIKEQGRLSAHEAYAVLAPVIEALAHAHAVSIIHRDLKPDNIFLHRGAKGTVTPKLLDFGVAKLVDPQAPGVTTKTGALLGTPLYMSPEQAAGDGDTVGPWSDVYSLAAVLFHLLAGRPPYVGESFGKLILQHVQAPPPSLLGVLPEAPASLDALIQKAMAKAPAKRYFAMRPFLEAFQAAVIALPAPSPDALTLKLGLNPAEFSPNAAEIDSLPSAAASAPPRVAVAATWLEGTGKPPLEARDRGSQGASREERKQGEGEEEKVPLGDSTLSGSAAQQLGDREVVAGPPGEEEDPSSGEAGVPVSGGASPKTKGEKAQGGVGVKTAALIGGLVFTLAVGLGALFLFTDVFGGASSQSADPRQDHEKPRTDEKGSRDKVRVDPKTGITWVRIPGGAFQMGSKAGEPDEMPVHRVEVKTFWMAKTEVTVAQYRRCVQAGRCSVPATGEFYNWDEIGRGDHPINGVTWRQASQFARWAKGRLPSEAEWEYAARSGGEAWKFPWGDRKASCLFAVMDDGASHGASGKETDGCGKNRTWSVCSKPRGNTTHGLCDMAGNVNEWVEDWYHTSYKGAPKTGEARKQQETTVRVSRGGSLISGAKHLRVTNRIRIHPKRSYITLGLRPVRSF